MAWSHGSRSASSSGIPLLIFATLFGGWKESPSSTSQPSRAATPRATVVLPLPETPIITTTHIARPLCLVQHVLEVPAEAEAHRREGLFAERVLAAGAEAGEQRGGEHVRGHRLLDGRLDGPATLAGILDEAGEVFELLVGRERAGGEVEQPGG